MEMEHFVALYLRDYISQNFESLLTNKQLCDVIFEVGNEFNKKQFHCVKCLFSIHSQIFYELLYSESNHANNNNKCIIEIMDITPDAFEYIRALFYGLNPQIKMTNVIQIYHASNLYDIEPLKQFCLNFLYEIIPSIYQINIFIKLLNELIRYNYHSIIPDILNNLNLTQTHFEQMLKMDNSNKIFSNSPFQLIEQLLFLPNHKIFGNITQEQKWTACMKWSLFQSKKHQKNGCINVELNNNKYLKQFIKYFDFKSFNSQFFIENVAKLNILNDSYASEILNYHCTTILNSIDKKYDNIIMNSDGLHINIPNILSESSSIIKIQHYSGGYLCVDEYSDNNVNVRFDNNNDDYYEWIGIEDQNGFWKFQNVATSKFLCVTPKIKDTNDHILKCNDIDGKSLFCMFMIHITPWKHCRFEPIFIHPNYYISIKEKNIELSIKNGLYEEFKMIPIGNDDNKIENKNDENLSLVTSTTSNMASPILSDKDRQDIAFEMKEMNITKDIEPTIGQGQTQQQHDIENIIEIKENNEINELNNESANNNNNSVTIDHPLMDRNESKWKGDKILTIEDKFGSYVLAIKGAHSCECVANRISDDLSEWIIQYHRKKEDIVRFKNKKSGKYLRLCNHGYSIDCNGLENDKLSEFKISHSEQDWHLCRIQSVVYNKYCIGLGENGIVVTHDVASDSLVYIRFE